jgi:hypothetical protein
VRFWYPDDNRAPETSWLVSVIYGVVVGLATTLVMDIADVLLGCSNASPLLILEAYPYILPTFGIVPAIAGAIGSFAFDGFFRDWIGVKSGRIIMFVVIVVMSFLLLLSMLGGKQVC